MWTWNAIGKAPGAWGLSDDANESQRGFLLNHLISEELPGAGGAAGLSNSDPITGQAAWYDVRVRISAGPGRRAGADLAAVQGRAGGARHDGRRAALARLLRRTGGRSDAAHGGNVTQLALVIDLNVCVGCHACVTSCKQWNTSGSAGPLADMDPYGADPNGTFFNRVQTFEVGEFPNTQTVHFPKSLPALRRPALRAGVPHRRQLQARRRRHRARRLRQVHRLQVLQLGLPLRRARARREAQGDDQVHAVRRPHPRRGAARARAQAGLRAGLPDQRAPVRRHPRPRVGGFAWPSRSAPATR